MQNSTKAHLVTQSEADALPWHHQLDLGNGVITKGHGVPLNILKAQADIYFAGGIAGKTVLDIGCWDGFNSFEAERRGARRVLATDHYAWSDQCWGKRESFELAKRALNSKIDARDIALEELSVESVGKFDIVLFLGVFYHLKNPFAAVEQVAQLAGETLIVETFMDASEIKKPAMIMYPKSVLNNDPSNWWGPNQACVEAMLDECGFRNIKFLPHPTQSDRGIFISRR